MENITALVSCFARAYHFRNASEWVFRDDLAGELLGTDYEQIAAHMSRGIQFFAPEFQGSREEGLRYIVEHNLAPSVLGRSAFCQRGLDNAVRLGCRQYVLFAAGYDSFPLRNRDRELRVYELDRPELLADKKQRMERAGMEAVGECHSVPCDLAEKSWAGQLEKAGFQKEQLSFGSLLGIRYYLNREEFGAPLREISSLWSEGSSLCLDYPTWDRGAESEQNRALAAGAGEEMKARYTYEELERLLEGGGFLIYEHLDREEMTRQFFAGKNCAMTAPQGVGYCLAVKKG